MAQDRDGRPAVERVHPPDALMKAVNPVMRRVLTSRFGRRMGDMLLLLRYTGRTSGRRYEIPVGYHAVDGRLTLLTNSGWRVNFRGGRDAEVFVRGRWLQTTATLDEDPDVVAAWYAREVRRLGRKAAQRRLGIRINVDRDPTLEELREAIERSGLSMVRLDLAANER